MWLPFWLLAVIQTSYTIQLNKPSGEFSSPNHPLPYPANSTEVWEIPAPEGYIAKIYIPYFDIERSDGCQASYLQILSEGKELARLCGKWDDGGIDPGLHEYYSTGNALRASFTSQGQQTRPFTGFRALYSHVGVRATCPAHVLPHSLLEPAWPKFNFRDTVKVTCLRGYEMVEGLKTIPSFYAECQQDGSWKTPGYSCQPVDCSIPPEIENGRVTFVTQADVTIYKSIIRYRCDEPYYQLQSNQNQFYCSSEATWENNGTGQVLPECIPVCGKPSNPVIFRERIIRGSVAKRGNFPWQVLFQRPRGAGALISDQWVLTAAHVAEGAPSLSMVAGITSTKHLERDGTRLQPAEVFVHPGYRPHSGQGHNYNHDIALVRLRSKVRLGPDLSPICLPPHNAQHLLPVNKIGLVSGWGLTENDTLPTHLMFVRLPIRELAECRGLSTGHQVTITDNMICAGGQDGSDSCQGDSGGAFVFSYPKPRRDEFFVGGVVSWGIRCGTFGFYTKVMNYLDWIEEIMRNN
uniref:C1s2 n=1 Tax=Sphyrna zygaena TaxID=195335 RepID=A0A146GEF4_SPHZY|nr:C1s2 [Sphyrna zygaena]